MKTKEAATKKAKLLISKMKTKGWKISIWENLGWHYKITLKNMAVYPDTINNKFYAMLSDGSFPGTSPGYWLHEGVYKDPNKAVKVALKEAKNFTLECHRIVDQMEEALGN